VIYWVAPHIDEWSVTQQGRQVEEAIFDGRDDAIAWACRVASRRSPALVRVQDYSGNITAQFSFESASELAKTDGVIAA
jgi:hypothetical protein